MVYLGFPMVSIGFPKVYIGFQKIKLKLPTNVQMNKKHQKMKKYIEKMKIR